MNNLSPEMDVLWERIRHDDAGAVVILYEKHYTDLLTYGIQLSKDLDYSKDLINDIFLHLWEKRRQLKPVANTRAYLFACLRRKFYQQTGNKTQVQYLEDELLQSISAQSIPSQEEMLIAIQHTTEIRQRVQQALSKLTGRQQELIRMRYYDQLNYEQMEAATGIAVKTIYNTIYNAMKVLSAELKGVPVITLLLFYFEKR
ncbi:RNA polymerase sigma factor [Chitinophaga sp. Mgbs1]|uniref:RNA polymerase sigma factor n=1 Tax=Chitinophaga solisilvae TaxID=1233460 RepID=A0A9Q5D5K6_9BACT|nr:RNA polymerase sigma factor [Chitinophaga solisilvae]